MLYKAMIKKILNPNLEVAIMQSYPSGHDLSFCWIKVVP